LTKIYYSGHIRDGSKIAIKDMVSSDVEDWYEIFNSSTEYETTRMKLADAKDYFKSRLGMPGCLDLVAKIDKTLVGYRGLTIFADESRHVAITSGVYTHSSFRRKGIAVLMINVSEEIAKQNGVRLCHGYTLATNKPTIELYTKKLGYVICGSLSKAAKMDSTYVDIIILCKEL
jgi:ribosomal protein S18 acetylase RimI-like enzyme